MEERIIMVVENKHYQILKKEFVYKETIERVVDKDTLKQYAMATWLYKAQGSKYIHFRYNHKTSRFAPDVLEDYFQKIDIERLLSSEITLQIENKETHEMQLSKLSFQIENGV